MSRYEYKVEWCYVCDQGWVEIVRHINSHRLLFQCSECMSQWNGIEELKNRKLMKDEVVVTKPQYEEIMKLGWSKLIITE